MANRGERRGGRRLKALGKAQKPHEANQSTPSYSQTWSMCPAASGGNLHAQTWIVPLKRLGGLKYHGKSMIYQIYQSKRSDNDSQTLHVSLHALGGVN